MLRPVDRASVVPLWAQVGADLRRRIASGEFGDRLPTEASLVADYDVSRHTVREALRDLKTSGVVRSQRGRGTSIAHPGELEQSLLGLYSMARAVATAGLPEHSVVLVDEERVAGEAAADLALGADDPVRYVERVRHAGDEPLSLDRSWVPADLGRRLERADLEHGSLYDALTVRCDVTVLGGSERISPAVPEDALRDVLRMPRGQAVFVVTRLVHDARRPVERRISQVRGDRYRFVAHW